MAALGKPLAVTAIYASGSRLCCYSLFSVEVDWRCCASAASLSFSGSVLDE
jgi:hypothetical protein